MFCHIIKTEQLNDLQSQTGLFVPPSVRPSFCPFIHPSIHPSSLFPCRWELVLISCSYEAEDALHHKYTVSSLHTHIQQKTK